VDQPGHQGTVTVKLIMEPPRADEMQAPPRFAGAAAAVARPAQARRAMSPTTALSTFGWFVWRLGEGVPMPGADRKTFTGLCRQPVVQRAQLRSGNALRRCASTSCATAGWRRPGAGHIAAICGDLLAADERAVHTTPHPAAELGGDIRVASLVLWVAEARKFVVRWMLRTHLTGRVMVHSFLLLAGIVCAAIGGELVRAGSGGCRPLAGFRRHHRCHLCRLLPLQPGAVGFRHFGAGRYAADCTGHALGSNVVNWP